MSASIIDSSLLETVVCPICGESRYRVLQPARYPSNVTREELLRLYSSSSDHALMDQLVCCAGCAFIYLNPRINASIIVDSYSNAVDPVFFEQNPMRIKTFQRSFGRIVRTLALQPNPGKPILDIGCAGGAFLKAASELGFHGIGVEPSRWLCEQGKKLYGLDLRPGILSDHAFAPKSFSIISLWDVLEHLTHPGAVLDDVAKLLSDDGTLIINVPDHDSLARQLLRSHWPFYLSVHLSYFTPASLQRLLDQHGFKVLGVRPYFQTLELGYVLQRASSWIKPLGWGKTLLEKVGLDHVPFVYTMGQITVLARKK